MTKTVTIHLDGGGTITVGDWFLNMSNEEQDAWVARNRPPVAHGKHEVMAPLNQGIAEGLGAPVDLLNAGLGKIGLGSESPFAGSESIQRGMDMIGVEHHPAREGDYYGQAAQGIGNAAGSLPFLAAGKFVQGAGAVPQAVRSLGQSLSTLPAMATELMAGGAGRVGAENPEWIEPAVGKALAPLASGILASGGVAAMPPGRIAASLLAKSGGKAMGALKAPAMNRAGERMQGLVENPQAISNRIDPAMDIPPAAQTGNPELMALQRSVFDHNPVGLAAYNKALNKATMSGISKMKEFGDPANMRGYLKERRSAVIDALSRKKKSAQDVASRTVDELKPGMTRKGSSIQARTKIESAAAAARAEEKRMWEAIPDETKVGTDDLHRRFRELDAGLPSAQRSDMPEDAARLLGKGGELLGTKLEVHGLYSRMREVARQSAAAGNRNKARIAGEIADAAMDALDASAVGPAMRDAVAKSRQVNETFSQGTVGRTLARSRAGGPAVPEELTLQKALGAGGLAGDVAVRDIIRAAPDSAGSIEQYLRGRAVGETVKKGEINPQAANKFAGSNAEMLANFPAIPGDLKRALAAHSKVARMSGKGAGLLDPKKSVGAKVLAEMAGGEVASVFNDPRLVKRLADQVRRSPDAMKGLAQGIADHVMLKSRSGVSDAGGYIISGKKMLAFAKEHEASIRAGMGDAGYSRISTIAKTLAKVEEAGGALPDVGHTMQDLPSNILRYAAGVLGARGGAQLGAGTSGASLKTASSGSKLLTKFAEKLTPNNAVRLFRDATYDPELYKAILMTGKATEKAQRESVGILNAWLAGTAIGIEGGSE